VTGSKTDIKVKGKKCIAELAPSRRQQLTGLPATAEEAAADAAVDAAAAQAAGASAAELQDPQLAVVVPVQRLFEFAAEVWPTPADGPFRATKVVSIKSKYILFNDTGVDSEEAALCGGCCFWHMLASMNYGFTQCAGPLSCHVLRCGDNPSSDSAVAGL
jgi:hypothetical protein